MNAGRRVGAALPPATYQETRYETLVAEPEATLKRLYAFLEEPYSPAVLPPRPRRTGGRPFWIGTQAPTWAARAEVVRSSVGKWKDRMARSDRIRFESVAGDLLEELGYEVEGLARVIPRREQLRWELQHAAWHVFWRLNRKRKHRWMAGEFALRWSALRHRMRWAGGRGPGAPEPPGSTTS